VRVRPWHILLATWIVVVLYAFPGYMNWDSGAQLWQARTKHYGDWYPPLMAVLWRYLDRIVGGPILMMLAQTGAFLWGLYAILETRFEARTAATIAAVLMLFPPILTPMAAVWKDAQMAGYLMAGFALALRPSRRARIAGVLLLALGTAMRDNAAAALPPLCLLICGAWGFRSRIRAFFAAVGLCVGIVVAVGVTSFAVTVEHAHPWYRTVAIMDMAGTICHADPMDDRELGELLAGTGRIDTTHLHDKICSLYNTRVWFALSQGDAHYWNDPVDRYERSARLHAWWQIVSEHPVAYLEHRAAVMAELLGLTDQPIWEPVCQTVNPNPNHKDELHHDFSLSIYQRVLGACFVWLGTTFVYRPWIYAVLSLIFLGWAVIARDRFVLAVAGSGLLYEASYFIVTAAPDFRYSHWMVTCTCITAATIFVERLRARRAASASPPA